MRIEYNDLEKRVLHNLSLGDVNGSSRATAAKRAMIATLEELSKAGIVSFRLSAWKSSVRNTLPTITVELGDLT